MSAPKGSQLVGQICKKMMRNWKGRSRLIEGLALFYWPKVVGMDIARKTVPDKMMAGTIWVKTSDPTLAHQLSFLAPKIVREYENLLGSKFVQNVRFVIGQMEIVQSYLGQNEIKDIDLPDEFTNYAATIEENELRERFIRVAKKAYAKDYHLRQKGWKPCSCGILTEDGDLCFECRRREDEENRSALRFFLLRNPKLTWEEMQSIIPQIGREEWEITQRELRSKFENELRTRILAFRRNRENNINTIVAPAKQFLFYGGNQKLLQNIIGMDYWSKIEKLLVDNPNQTGMRR